MSAPAVDLEGQLVVAGVAAEVAAPTEETHLMTLTPAASY